jgi:hypothetical protein
MTWERWEWRTGNRGHKRGNNGKKYLSKPKLIKSCRAEEKEKYFQLHSGSGVDTASNRNEYQKYFLEGKCGRCVGLTTLPSSCADCLKNLQASTCCDSQGLSRPVRGWLYLYLFWHLYGQAGLHYRMTLLTVPSDRDVRTCSTSFRVYFGTSYVTICVRSWRQNSFDWFHTC